MAKLISIFWRDIPSHVIGKSGREKSKKELPPKFAQAIDRAAMRAGRGSSDAYLADWRRETQIVSGDLDTLVSQQASNLENKFDDETLEKVIKSGGLIGDKND